MNILIVRVSSLGDVLHNLPMVADILRHLPTARIDWVVEEHYVDLVRMNPAVRTVIPFALRRWRRSLSTVATRAEIAAFRRTLRRQAYDVVFDTQGLIKTAVVMRMARLAAGGRRVGLANATEGSGYEGISRIFHSHSIRVDPRTHAVERGRQVAAAALGYVLDTPANFNLQRLPLQPPPTWLPAQPFAVFFHATARAAKQWPVESWLALGEDLAERGMSILLPWGSAAEHAAAAQLAAHMPNATVLPKLSMMEAIVLAQQAALVVGLDTGLTHIAAALDRPTIELYVDSPRWKTEGNWSARTVNLGDSGRPPSVAEARAAIATLLSGSAATAGVAV